MARRTADLLLTSPVLRVPAGTRRRSVAPRIGSAAVRIADPQLALALPGASGQQFFVHEGARRRLERRLNAAFGRVVQLAVTDNLRDMVTHGRGPGARQVRVHMMFLDAPDSVQDALVAYVATGSREASRIVGEYIDRNSHRLRASRPFRGVLRTKGKVHDLAPLLTQVQEAYFGGANRDVSITWGRRTGPREGSRQSVQFGSYSASARLIRVNPVLDRRWVPRYFVAYIVFHEHLHHVIPEVRVGGRSVLHSPEFHRREREFRSYERAIAWERAHMGRLLRLSG